MTLNRPDDGNMFTFQMCHEIPFALNRAGRIKPQVMRTYPLEQFADALQSVQRGEVQGKAVLTLSSPARA